MGEEAQNGRSRLTASMEPHPFRPICIRCGRILSSDSSLLNHLKKHHPDLYAREAIRRGLLPEAITVFRCCICGRKFMTVEGYRKHMARKHPSSADSSKPG